jgi:hypothetical protein
VTSPGAALVAGCRFLTTIKYRVDDVMDALWQRIGMNEPVLSDPLFQRLGIGSAVLDPDGIDWLEALGQDPAMNDDLWLAARHPDWHRLECLDIPVRYALAPYSFARLALPSGDHDIDYKERRPGELSLNRVDPSLVIGGTYSRAWPATLSDDQLDEINTRASAAAPGTDTAYVKVGRLPLYLAVEGKNRVRAFRSAGKLITAFTRTATFPEPEALRLHHVAGAPSVAVSGATPGDLQPLILASATVPLLESYGVPWGPPLDADSTDGQGRPLELAPRAALTDLITHFMHP